MAAPRKADGVDLSRVTITDVARKAEVSPATVSRVLNGSSPVSPVLARRVEAAAAKLGHRPFGPAHALRQQLTRVWAAIVADIENPWSSTTASAATRPPTTCSAPAPNGSRASPAPPT